MAKKKTTSKPKRSPIGSLAEAERIARTAIRRRRLADHVQGIEDRLAAATGVHAAARRRQEALRAVLRTPRRVSIRARGGWLDVALQGTPEDPDDYMTEPAWSTP